MRCHLLFVFSALASVPLPGFTTRIAPPWGVVRVKHSWNAVPANWESLGPPPAGTTIDLHVALQPDNEDALIDVLLEVSTPRHPNYGAHFSKEEVAKLVTPHSYTLELVHSWLEHHGVPSSSISTTHGGGWLTLSNVPVSQANKLLGASYQLYQNTGTKNSTILRTVGYALPAVLHRHVQTVAPTTFFGDIGTLRQTPRRRSAGAATALAKVGPREPLTETASRDETKLVTPKFLRWLYKTTTYVPAATDQNALGIAGYADDFASSTDLTKFMSIFRTDAVAASFTVEKVNGGGYDVSHPGDEGNLDMQYAQAIAYPTPHIFYSTGGHLHWEPSTNEPDPDDSWHAWLKYMLDQKNFPPTISTSYGFAEKDIPREYAKAICNLYLLLGLRGVSVLFASGDDGVGRNCKADGDSKKVQFIPWFPASCPWVTSVGGTTSHLPEVAASLSGGGFSNYFPIPVYQKDVMPSFFQHLGKEHEGSYNDSGRGIPDIAAQALNFGLIHNADAHVMSGTSCAAPTVAGIISLLNDFLLSYDKKPLGFLNPWLYDEGLSGITDIISGSNPGCGTDGFSAIAGWDPVTGLGTPNFFKWRQDILVYKILDKRL